MEFETNTLPAEKEIARADAPRMTIQPINPSNVELPPMHTQLDTALTMQIDSETESTASDASNSIQEEFGHHRTALFTGIVIAVLFSSTLAIVYLLR